MKKQTSNVIYFNWKENVSDSLLDIALQEKVAVDDDVHDTHFCLVSIQRIDRETPIGRDAWQHYLVVTIKRGFSFTIVPSNQRNKHIHKHTAKKHAYIAMWLRRMRQRVDELLIVGFRKEKHISLFCCSYVYYTRIL